MRNQDFGSRRSDVAHETPRSVPHGHVVVVVAMVEFLSVGVVNINSVVASHRRVVDSGAAVLVMDGRASRQNEGDGKQRLHASILHSANVMQSSQPKMSKSRRMVSSWKSKR